MAALEAMATTSHDAAAAAATTAKSAAPTAGGVAGGRGGSGGGGGSAVGRVARSSRREVHSWAIATGNPLQHAIPAADRELDGACLQLPVAHLESSSAVLCLRG